MYNMAIRKWINDIEKDVDQLKQDYEIFEKNTSEVMRQELKKDISEIRKKVTIVNTKISDLIWW